MELVIASQNLHKIREFRELLKSFKQIDVLSLLNFPQYAPLPDVGGAFKEIVVQKSLHAAQSLQKWVLADDSGLVVPALKGEPGTQSRYYAGEDATDAENRQKLLLKMQNLKEHERTAYFECSLALTSPDGLKKCVTGIAEGFIANEERGRNGFGYDMIFIKNEYDKTFAELEERVKIQISHRRKAFEKLIPILESLQT
jgi:XTP/dITP diphosphohydrolase